MNNNSMSDYLRSMPTCDVCGNPFTEEEWDNRHTGHEPDCLFVEHDEEETMDLEETFNLAFGCECDINYHEDCCPDCEGNDEQ